MPPVMVSVKLMVAPTQTVARPEMLPATGSGLMVIVLVDVAVPQLLVTEYWITAEPEVKPEQTPVREPMEAVPVEALDHSPPAEVLVNAIDEPTHTILSPEIEPASGAGRIPTL